MPVRDTSIALPSPNASILWRMVTQAVILTTFIIVLFSTVSFILAQALLQQSVLTQLSSVASASEDGLEQTLSLARERASLLTANTDVKRIVSGQAPARDLERLLVLLQRDEPALSGIELYNPSGVLLAKAGTEIGLPEEARSTPYHRALTGTHSWEWYDAFTPVWEDGQKSGIIALRYKAQSFIEPLLKLLPAAGESTHLVFSLQQNGRTLILHPFAASNQSYLQYVELSDELRKAPVLRALGGEEGIGRMKTQDGIDALTVYRSIPSLGWGMSVEIDRMDALHQTKALAFSQATLGALLIILSIALSYLLSSELTAPLRGLTRRVALLRPGHWQTQRTVRTDDEVGLLDAVIVDVGTRLQKVYQNQEREIERRTDDLKKQYTLDRTILEGIDQGVITVDRKGVVTGVNPSAARLLLAEREDILGKQGTTVVDLRVHRGTKIKTDHPLKVCLKKHTQVRSPANAHWSIMRHDGSMLPVMLAISPLGHGKTNFGAIIVMQDITEERRLDYLKSEFITLASHQLRTPLSAIRWYVELFQEEKKTLTDSQRSYLREIDHGLERMVALLTALLHAAHLEGEGLKPEIQAVNASALVREMEEDCRAMAGEAGVHCGLNAHGRNVMMQTDPTLLRIVLQNLVSNAVKYSRKGKKITIGFSQTKTKIIFTVADQGVGIPKEEQKRVFQRFFRAKNVRQLDTDGNGLGLYITKSIVERLGGTIAFKSHENEGTIFTVTFPVRLKKKRS